MQTIALGSSGSETTRLGRGCSSVMGSVGRRGLLALLLYSPMLAEATAATGDAA